jgi:hypothetical protein
MGSAPQSPAPLLSACLIVKDEEELLPDCLASLAGVVDEIVVYDTGSTDRTVEIAQAAGATVLRGYWDDDFGRARNAALEACSGRWVLHLDADERFVEEATGLRALLARATEDKLNLRIDNVAPDGVGIGFSHHGTRLFRRTRGRWLGRLHEQVVQRPGQPPLKGRTLDEPHVLHVGYRDDIVADRDKLARNIRVAERELALGAEHLPHAMLSLGRALGAAGRHEEALDRFVEARAISVREPGVLRQVVRNGAQTLLELGRPSEALSWTEELRQLPGSERMADFLECLVRLNLGEYGAAVDLLDQIDVDVVDQDGFSIPTAVLAVNRGLGLLGGRRWAEAAEVFTAVVRDSDAKLPVWAPLVESAGRAGADVRALADLVAEEDTTGVLGQLINVTPGTAEAFADALWERRPGPALLAFAARIAPQAGLERAMEWSARLRAAGVDSRCPVVALARDEEQPPLARVQAACVATAGFADPAGAGLLRLVAPDVPLDQVTAAVVEVATLAPALLRLFIEASAVGPLRCLVVARTLHELGAPDEALAVFEHGFAQPGPRDSLVDEAAAWLRRVGHDGRATELLAAS